MTNNEILNAMLVRGSFTFAPGNGTKAARRQFKEWAREQGHNVTITSTAGGEVATFVQEAEV